MTDQTVNFGSDDSDDDYLRLPRELFARLAQPLDGGTRPLAASEPARAPIPTPSRRSLRRAQKDRPASALLIGCDRLDPYYDGIWTTDPHGLTWASASLLRARQEAGLITGSLGLYGTPKHAARARMTRTGTPWDVETKVAYLGALQSYRTLTGEQLTAITGIDVNSKTGRRTLSDLFALDAIRIGSPVTIGTPARTDHGALVYQLHNAYALRKEVGQYLTAEQQEQILGHRDWQAGVADRHDMLSAELLLRLAQPSRGNTIWTVLAERQSHIFDIAINRFGLHHPPRLTDRAADATLVLNNGSTVFVELTASRTPGLAAKLESYARMLANFTARENGAILLVLVAPDPFHGDITADIERAVIDAVRKHPGSPTNVVADRMLIAEWPDWFPERHHASNDFLNLRARRINPRTRAMLWETAELTRVIPERHKHLTDSASALAIASLSGLYVPIALRALLNQPHRYDDLLPMPRPLRRPAPPSSAAPTQPSGLLPMPSRAVRSDHKCASDEELLPLPGGPIRRDLSSEQLKAVADAAQPWPTYSAPEPMRRRRFGDDEAEDAGASGSFS